MKFSVFTASTPDWTPAETAATLAQQGWDGIEWRIVDQAEAETPGFWVGNRSNWSLTGLEGRLDELASITTSAGLEYSGIGGYARCDDHVDVERMLAATARLGARQVRVAVTPLPNRDPVTGDGSYRERFAAAREHFEWVAERAAAHGVKALVELHHHTLTSSASAALRLVDGLDPAHIGVIHDLGNLIIEGHEDFGAAFDLLGPYLAHVHVKNVAWVAEAPDSDGTVPWSGEWATLREGQGDVREYLTMLSGVGYDGWVTVEDFSTALPLAERTADNLAYLRSLVSS